MIYSSLCDLPSLARLPCSETLHKYLALLLVFITLYGPFPCHSLTHGWIAIPWQYCPKCKLIAMDDREDLFQADHLPSYFRRHFSTIKVISQQG
jgi:hypothetical protein